MVNAAQNSTVSAIAKGATAQLREILPLADRDTARRAYDELRPLVIKLEKMYGFGRNKPFKVVKVG